MRRYLVGEVVRPQLAKTGLEWPVPGDICRLADGRELRWYFQQMHVDLGDILFNLLGPMTGETIKQEEDWDALVHAVTEVVAKKLESSHSSTTQTRLRESEHRAGFESARPFPHVNPKFVPLCCVVLVSYLGH